MCPAWWTCPFDFDAKSYTQWPDTGNAGSKVASQASACVK